MNSSTDNSHIPRSFSLLAFTENGDLTFPLFFGMLLVYLVALVGNAILITLVCLVPQLHTPMYMFLCNLSVQDILYVSIILPKFLAITISRNSSISFQFCITQDTLFIYCVEAEFLLLSIMSYDRYVAICLPLRYFATMNNRTCGLLAFTSWFIAVIDSLPFSLLISNLSFCKSKEINHLFCDLKALLKISCNDTTNITNMILIQGSFIGCLPFLLILTSYANIIFTVLQIRSSDGKMKAFSTCSSHLTVVLMFCGTCLGQYMIPKSESSEEQDKVLSLLYVAIVPMLNPLVYSLRNKQVLTAFEKLFKITQSSE
ncbi:olfactory receptor 8D1-like [Bufo gargarizans]|uniref:olfactory receptor 8D1-like n=1 Tax=Bufo gargarizans TaxID=30331 RepID=UPI001CF5F9B4|nr:olfactory receptor 8D1-like [Bufo gargarizans]